MSVADILLRGDVERDLLMRNGDGVFVPDSADKKVFTLAPASAGYRLAVSVAAG